MTYSPGGPGYPGAQTTQLTKSEDGPSKLPVYLLGAVAVMGLAAYLLSFGPLWEVGDAGVGVPILGMIAILFAALFAVIALVPKQGKFTAVVTATAAVGFLMTIWDLVNGGGAAGWALIAIVVLSALQTVAAIAALLLDAGVITPPAPRPKYDQYPPYGSGFYGQPQFGNPPSIPQGPPTGPHGPGQHGPQSYGQPQGGPPPYGYQGGQPSGGFPPQGQGQPRGQHGQPSGPPTPPTGFPTYAQPPSGEQSSGQQSGGEQQQAAEPSPEGATQVAPIPQQQQPSSPSSPPPS